MGWWVGGLVVGGWVGGLVGGWVGGWVGVVCVVCVVCGDFELWLWLIVFTGKHSQVESVAGAAHLPNDYAGVLK